MQQMLEGAPQQQQQQQQGFSLPGVDTDDLEEPSDSTAGQSSSSSSRGGGFGGKRQAKGQQQQQQLRSEVSPDASCPCKSGLQYKVRLVNALLQQQLLSQQGNFQSSACEHIRKLLVDLVTVVILCPQLLLTSAASCRMIPVQQSSITVMHMPAHQAADLLYAAAAAAGLLPAVCVRWSLPQVGT
jgi:hypothetical protein